MASGSAHVKALRKITWLGLGNMEMNKRKPHSNGAGKPEGGALTQAPPSQLTLHTPATDRFSPHPATPSQREATAAQLKKSITHMISLIRGY